MFLAVQGLLSRRYGELICQHIQRMERLDIISRLQVEDMDKYIKRWVQWCDSCGHGFKVDADIVQFTAETKAQGFIAKLLKRSPKIEKKNVKPKPSPCPVCGKTDNVTVIKLQEDKVYVAADNSN